MLSVVVQSHPKRVAMADSLASELDAEVVFDPDPQGPPSAWRSYRACLEHATVSGCVHRLIVQDDATVSVGFLEAARAACAANPRAVVLFYVGGNAPRLVRHRIDWATARGEAYAAWPPHSWLPVVATSWPTCHLADVLDWIKSREWGGRFHADDAIAGEIVNHLNLDVVLTVPSLVQHADVAVSLVGTKNRSGEDRGRVAHNWLAPPSDARALAW